MFWILLLHCAFLLASADRKRFDGCEVWELKPTTKFQLNLLVTFFELHDHDDDDRVTFWEEPSGVNQNNEVLVCAGGKIEFRKFMQHSKLFGKIVSTDIQKNFDAIWSRNEARHASSPLSYVQDDYNTYDDIINQLAVLQSNCPEGLTCSVENIGSSVEDRPIVIFRMTKDGENRHGVFLDSLTHAREWLSGATLMGILSRLVNEYGSNPEATKLVDNYDWHVVPVVNPDGYVYTWTDFRMWRKNRRINSGSSCMGVDLNRNYDYEWGKDGSSGDPCSSSFRGESPASEPEIQAIQAAGEALRGELILWVSYHTFAEFYLFSYGLLDPDTGICIRAPDHDDMDRVGQAAVAAVQETYNEGNWVAGNTCEVLYSISGSTQDWAYGKGLVKYSFMPELRGPGFDPSPSNIIPSVEENWNGLVAMLNEIEEIEGF